MIKNVTLIRITPFNDSSHPHDLVPPFSIGYLATILDRKGFNVHVIDTLVEPISKTEIIKLISRYESEVVFIDSTSSSDSFLGQLSRDINLDGKAKVWSIGQYASTLPKILLEKNRFVEGCIIKEVENTAVDLIECFNSGGDLEKVRGIAFSRQEGKEIIITEERELIEDLDQLPPINYRLLNHDKYRVFSVHISIFSRLRWGFLLTSRGCPYECIYCSPTLRESYGKKFRANSAKVVVDQMEELINKYKMNVIAFQDENFTFDRERTIAICDEIIKRSLKIKWVIQTRADHLDRELLRSLKNAGCTYIGIGVESGSDRILELLKKGETKDRIRLSIQQAHEIGISTIAFFMIGNPTETHQELMQTFKFAKELQPMMIQVAFFTSYPGSENYETFRKKEDDLEGLFHYDPIRSNSSKVATGELIKFQKIFYLKYFLSWSYVFKYLRHRAPFAIFNNQELGLLCKTFKCLLK